MAGNANCVRRILMTVDAVGGVWTYAMNLCSHIAREGVEIALAVIGPSPNANQRREASLIEGVTVFEAGFELEWMPSVTGERLTESGKWLRSIEQRFQPEVIHLNGYVHASLPWRSPVLVTAHSCVASWWRAVHGEMPPNEWHAYCARVAAGLASADAVVAPTSWMLSQLQESYGVSLRNAYVIHNFSPEAQPCGPKRDVICSGGRIWDAAKNFAILDAAAPSVEWPISVFGEAEGPEGSSYRPYHLRLVGVQPRSAIADMLSGAAIFAHPSLYEPFGLCVLEAAWRRCALVLADIPSLRELWEGAALFAPARDVEAWVSCLNLLVESPSLRSEYGNRAVRQASRYSETNSVAQYRLLYSKLVLGARGACRTPAVSA